MSKVEHRSEILFLYDVTFANPNGDPNDENKPRIDEESGINIVTDVRLKRTIRDYLHDFKHEEIFIREIRDEDGYLQDAKTRARDFLPKNVDLKTKSFREQQNLIKENILASCIDVRLFGGTIPLELTVPKKDKPETGSVTLTGPVQFRMGHSLHRINLQFLKGTGAFASSYEKGNSKKSTRAHTFREEYVLPYSFIAFWGVINENAGKFTNLSQEDIDKLIEALWNGTKNLISRTKVGQVPRLLLRLNYKKPHFFIGDLDHKVAIISDKRGEQLRSFADFQLDCTALLGSIADSRDAIQNIEYKLDGDLKCIRNGQPFQFDSDTVFVPFKFEF